MNQHGNHWETFRVQPKCSRNTGSKLMTPRSPLHSQNPARLAQHRRSKNLSMNPSHQSWTQKGFGNRSRTPSTLTLMSTPSLLIPLRNPTWNFNKFIYFDYYLLWLFDLLGIVLFRGNVTESGTS